jgi:hypothetical protein
MYYAMISNLINNAYLICKIDKNSKECKVAWDQVEDVMRSKRNPPPPKKPAPIDKDIELSQREYDI